MARNTSVQDLSAAIQRQLGAYQEGVMDNLKDEIKAASKECLNAIREKSPKDSGEYAKGWKVKTVSETPTQFSAVIYNAKHGSLTHLLEHGHAKAGGGRVEGHPHIAPAEDALRARLENNVRLIVSNSRN